MGRMLMSGRADWTDANGCDCSVCTGKQHRRRIKKRNKRIEEKQWRSDKDVYDYWGKFND